MRALLVLALLALAAPAALGALAPRPALQVLGNDVTASVLTGFSPPVVYIPVGGSITWENHEDNPHTVTSVLGGPPDVDLPTHAVVTVTFPEQAVIPYHCTIHAWMVGLIVVAG